MKWNDSTYIIYHRLPVQVNARRRQGNPPWDCPNSRPLDEGNIAPSPATKLDPRQVPGAPVKRDLNDQL